MSRCKICDFSEDLPSIYNDSLTSHYYGVRKRLRASKNGIDYYCNECHTIAEGAYQDIQYQQDDEQLNRMTVKVLTS